MPTVVLAGIPGVGKTQLARAYAYRSRRQYRLGWWLTAETTATLDVSLRTLAERLALDLDSPLDTLAEEVRQALARRRRWLLVFDNADRPAELVPFLPQHGRGQVLITSHHSRWQQLAKPLQVTPLPADDAITILLTRTGNHEPDAARELVEALHYLPLAVEQAAAYIGSQPDLSIARYLELFRVRQQQLLERGIPLDYQGRTVASVVAIALEQLSEATAAGQLLRLCAFLAPDQLPLRLLLSRGDRLPAPLAEAAADEVTRRDAEELLYRMGLLTEDMPGTAQLHALLQDAIRLYLPNDEQRTWARQAIEVLTELLDGEEENVSAKPERWAVLAPHVEAALEHALSRGLTFDGLARLLTMTGRYLWDRQQLEAAQGYLERALAMRQRLYGDIDHPDIATSLNNLGDALQKVGELPAARDYFEQALAMRQQLYGDVDHPDIADSLNNLGLVARDLGQLAVARDYLEQALAMRRQLYGDADHANIATSLNNLGLILAALGELPAAGDYFEQALNMWRRVHGDVDHRDIASSLNNLGLILRNLSKLPAARDHIERALAMRQRLYGGADHPDIARSLSNLGNVLADLDELAAARDHFEQGLAMFRRLHGDAEHPDIAKSLNNLGNVLRRLGNGRAAATLEAEADAINQHLSEQQYPIPPGLRNL